MKKEKKLVISFWQRLQQKSREENGFLLLEAAAAATLAVAAAALLSVSFLRLLPKWDYLAARHSLEGAARQLCTGLEKQIGVDSTEVYLFRSGDFSVADCQNVSAATTLRFYYNSSYNSIYRRTEKLLKNTAGVNPACQEGFTVEKWQLRRLNDKVVALDFTLARGKYKASFRHAIYCVNGRVSGDG